MATSAHDLAGAKSACSLFLTTHWSVVLAAKDLHSPGCAQALERLCKTYWRCVYVYIRSSGYSSDESQDLTQEFFARFLERGFLKVVDQEKGKFRAFLKVAVKRFLGREWVKNRAQKRGGGRLLLPLDMVGAEEHYRLENRANAAPSDLYDRKWALSLLEDVCSRLQGEYEATARAGEWLHLNPYLTAARGDIPYEKLAETLQMNPGAVRVAVHRLRKRFRTIFREAVEETVSQPEDLEDEIRYVIQALGEA